MANKKRPLTTPFYLFLINGITLCCGFVFVIILSLMTLEQTAISQTEQNLRTFAYAIKQLLQNQQQGLTMGLNPGNGLTSIDQFVKQTASHDPGFRISVIRSDGTVVGDSDAQIQQLENHLDRQEVVEALAGRESTSIRVSSVYNELQVYYAIPLDFQGQAMALRLSIPVNRNVFLSSSLRQDSIISTALVLGAILFVTFVIATKILRPLKELKETARQYAQGNFDYQPAVSSPKEFVELAEDIGSMGGTIQQNIQDISRRRDEFQAVFSSITEALIVFDSNLLIKRMNEAARSFFPTGNQLKPEGTSLVTVVRNMDIISFVQTIVGDTLLEQERPELETQILLPEIHQDSQHSTRSVLVQCVKIQDTRTIASPNSTSSNYILVISDISRLKRLERVRKDFVANVSHELKTPVTAITGFIETLQDGAIDDQDTARHFLDIMAQQSSRLNNIIDDLLTLSQLEQTGTQLETKPVSLMDIANDVLAAHHHLAQSKDISMTCDFFPADDAIQLSANPGLLSQALGNIVNNSVKYCPPGSSVRIRAWKTDWNPPRQTAAPSPEQAEPADPSPKVRIVVEDTGNGIPVEYQKRIFERFYRIDKGRSREMGGTGLGLSIVHHIIQLHGGTIRACNRQDGQKGACFEIELPGL